MGGVCFLVAFAAVDVGVGVVVVVVQVVALVAVEAAPDSGRDVWGWEGEVEGESEDVFQ